MSANKKRKKPAKESKAAELHRKYPGHGPIPPSKRAVIITLVLTVAISLILVFVFKDKTPVSQVTGDKYVQMKTSMGTIELELYTDKAPKTVAQFLKNVEGHKYDGLTFHRVVKGFMIQGGDPKGDGTGGSEVAFEKTGISFVRGVVAMASSQAGVTQSDIQFFIMQADNTGLDGQYASFGRVIKGMDVVDKIADVPVKANPLPSSEKSSPRAKITIIQATEVAN